MGFDLSDKVCADFAFYAMIVVLKMFVLAIYTSVQRFLKNSFATPEDFKLAGTEKPKIMEDHPAVERVKKNHLNDLENIPAFLAVGFLYTYINPDPQAALWHFRAFAWGRLVHTLSYQLGLQPWRALAYFAGFGSTISMAIQILRAL